MEADTIPSSTFDADDIPWFRPEPTVFDHLDALALDERDWLDEARSAIGAWTHDEIAAVLVDVIIERERYRLTLHAAMESIRFAENARTWALRSAGRL